MAAQVFEIHVCRDGRWQIDSTDATEKAAVAVANKKLGSAGIEAVRVVREGGADRQERSHPDRRRRQRPGLSQP
jgi:hypothetical protein